MMTEGGKRLGNILKVSTSGKPLVSILTAVLNGDKYLEQTIMSVLNQTYENIEYLIIDGGSTDSSVRIIKKHDQQIDYWCSRNDKGISDAFNYGIEKSAGEIIGIINSDDWYEETAVEEAVNSFSNNNCDVICGAIKFWINENQFITSLSDAGKIKTETSVHHSSVFIKKKAYERYGTFDTSYKYAMDYELLLRFKMKGAVYCQLNSVLANRRLSGLSYMNRREALRETKRARMNYFSSVNVWGNYLFVIVKDYLGRLTKEGKLLRLYKLYWKIKNNKLSKG